MLDAEKKAIITLRTAGVTHAEISRILGISKGSIKAFCSRNDVRAGSKICLQCFKCVPKGSTKFCSDKCRNEWWLNAKKQGYHNKKYRFVCEYCNKEFIKYRNDHPKYCSRECYLKSRYGDNG